MVHYLYIFNIHTNIQLCIRIIYKTLHHHIYIEKNEVCKCLCEQKDTMNKQMRLKNVYIERKKVLGKKVAWASGIVTKLEEKEDEMVDILFINNIPCWKNTMPPFTMDVTIEIREMERNKRGARVLHAIECHNIEPVKIDIDDDEDDIIKHNLIDKAQRNETFANFIVNQFNKEICPSLNLSTGNGIFDIAGGRGDLCRELLKYDTIVKQVSLIDPRPVIPPKKNRYNNNHKKELSSIQNICFKHFQCEYNRQFINENKEFLSNCSLFVGMHPDQPTELIIDSAFEMNKPFCIVPCCVYPSLFPDRKISTGQGVKRYSSFIQYLLEKDDRIQSKKLNFQGRNIVLYWFPSDKKQKGTKRNHDNDISTSRVNGKSAAKKVKCK